MKKALCALLAVVSAHAAEVQLASEKIMRYYDCVVQSALKQAEASGKKLTGDLVEFYREFAQLGCKKFIDKNPQTLKQAAKYQQELEKNPRQLEVIARAQEATEIAKESSSKENWLKELGAYSQALMTLVREKLPDLVPEPLLAKRIIANNGKQLTTEQKIAFGAGVLCVIAGIEQRSKAMNEKLFIEIFGPEAPLKSKAHETIASMNTTS